MATISQTNRLSIYDGPEHPFIEAQGFPVTFDPFDDEFTIDWNGAKLTIKGLSKVPSKLK